MTITENIERIRASLPEGVLLVAATKMQDAAAVREAIAAGVVRIRYMSTSHFLVGVMNVFVGGLRGLGYSFVSMIISLLGACALREVWIYTVFQLFPVLDTVYLSYPISWGLTALAQGICYARCLKKTIVQIDTRKA